MKTIEEGKDYLRANYEDGCDCPCCGQLVKLYKRPIHVSMAKDLIKLYQMHKSDKDWSKFYHISDVRTVTAGGGDFAKFVHWNLVEELEKDPNDTVKRTSGYWRITRNGILFVENRIKVKKYVLIYNSQHRGVDGDLVSIKDCLKDKFNYEELMNFKN